MASTDINGEPILILSKADALLALEMLKELGHDPRLYKLIEKLQRFEREANHE